jgi:hypothetical protein
MRGAGGSTYSAGVRDALAAVYASLYSRMGKVKEALKARPGPGVPNPQLGPQSTQQ